MVEAKPAPYIREGDEIVADDGSVTCRALKDIYTNEVCSPDDFEWIGRKKPKPGDFCRAEDGFKSTPYGTVIPNIKRAEDEGQKRIDKMPRF